MKWLKEKRKEIKKKGYQAGLISHFSTKNFKWQMMETQDMVVQDKENIDIAIRYYIAKEEKSPRMIQCYIVGQKDNLDKLPEANINKFLNSIELKAVDVQEKDAELYRDYVSSAAEIVFLRRGQKFLDSKQYPKAISIFTSLLNGPITDKLKARLHYLLSLCFLEKGITPYVESQDARDFQQAIHSAERSIEVQKDYWQSYFNIGIAYLNTREYNKAKKYLKQALSFCPKTEPDYGTIRFYYDEAKATNRYKRSISKMFSKENRITGFVYGEADPMVVISEKLYRVNDMVSGYTILKIARDKAYLKIGLRVDEFISGDLIIQPQAVK